MLVNAADEPKIARKAAGANERAGFNDAPVACKPSIINAANVKPMTNGATDEIAAFFLAVTIKITKTKMNVKNASINEADKNEIGDVKFV